MDSCNVFLLIINNCNQLYVNFVGHHPLSLFHRYGVTFLGIQMFIRLFAVGDGFSVFIVTVILIGILVCLINCFFRLLMRLFCCLIIFRFLWYGQFFIINFLLSILVLLLILCVHLYEYAIYLIILLRIMHVLIAIILVSNHFVMKVFLSFIHIIS